MKVLINAASIKEGGSRVVLNRLLAAMVAARPDFTWIVAANPMAIAGSLDTAKVSWLDVPLGSSVLDVLRWYEWELPALVSRIHPDVLFSQTNYLSHRALPCPSLLLIQNAGHFSPVFDRLTRAHLGSPFARWLWSYKSRWVHRSAKAATHLTVQTDALAEEVAKIARRPREEIATIPHGPGSMPHLPGPRHSPDPNPPVIGYISKWGVQKDFGTLFRAARLLQKRGRTFRLLLTLSEETAEGRATMKEAHAEGIHDLIENHGEVPEQKIMSLYDRCDIFVFPSLCESFGFPLVEAMARGLPMVVAATRENLEVTGGAALAFDPGDAAGMAEQLDNLLLNPAARADRSEKCRLMGLNYSWEKAALGTIAALERATSTTVTSSSSCAR